jgi:hypothetical protein
MKNVLLVTLGLSMGLILGWGIWEPHSSSTSVSLQSIQPATVSPVPNKSVTPLARPVGVDWQAFNDAHEKALRDNPELSTEYKELLQEAANQENEINAAMIKADPKVASILAKLEAQRHPSGAQSQ